MNETVSIEMGMRACIPADSAGPVKQRLLNAASQLKELTAAGPVGADGTNMLEFVELLEQIARLMRRARASAHNNPDQGDDDA